MNIEDFYIDNLINTRTYNICKNQKWENAADISEYFIAYKTFKDLENCGNKSNEELINIHLLYSNGQLDNLIERKKAEKAAIRETLGKLSKEELSQLLIFFEQNLKNLSNKTSYILIQYLEGGLNWEQFVEHILLSNQWIYNIVSLKHKKYLEEVLSLRKMLSNAILKINKGEDYICEEDLEFIVETNAIITKHNELLEAITHLTRIQRDLVNIFINFNYKALSRRSQNALWEYLEGNLKLHNFSEQILLNKYFDLSKIKNIGTKSIEELEIFIHIVYEFIWEIAAIKDQEELVLRRNKFFFKEHFDLAHIPKHIAKSNSIFEILEFLLNKHVIFEEDHFKIMKYSLKVYNNELLELDNLADLFILSRERIRQIRNSIIKNLANKLSFIKYFKDDLLANYGIDNSADYIKIDKGVVDKINSISQSNFSDLFIVWLLSIYLDNDFVLVGDIDSTILQKSYHINNKHSWSNLFLVRRDIATQIDFEQFVEDIHNRLLDKIEEDYTLNLRSYLYRFGKDLNINLLDSAVPVGEYILQKEYEIYLDDEDSIVFTRNTYKAIFEYIIEALEEIGRPAHIDEIYDYIEEKYPNLTKSKEALRGNIGRSNEIMCFSRTSTYGLKKWESEFDDVKGGSIRKIVVQYLVAFDEPLHIYQITEEVRKYRPETNATSIFRNLKLDQSDQFVFFNQSFIGLNNKIYNSPLTQLPKFFGKNIIRAIKTNPYISLNLIIDSFSKSYNISIKNMEYIIQQLRDFNFLPIQNHLYENKEE